MILPGAPQPLMMQTTSWKIINQAYSNMKFEQRIMLGREFDTLARTTNIKQPIPLTDIIQKKPAYSSFITNYMMELMHRQLDYFWAIDVRCDHCQNLFTLADRYATFYSIHEYGWVRHLNCPKPTRTFMQIAKIDLHEIAQLNFTYLLEKIKREFPYWIHKSLLTIKKAFQRDWTFLTQQNYWFIGVNPALLGGFPDPFWKMYEHKFKHIFMTQYQQPIITEFNRRKAAQKKITKSAKKSV